MMPTMEENVVTVEMPQRAGSRRGSSSRSADPLRVALEATFELLNKIAAWSFDRSDRIKDALLELAPDGLALYIVSKETAFDFELNKELAELVVSLVETAPIHAILVPSSAPVEQDGFKEGHPVLRLKMTQRHAE